MTSRFALTFAALTLGVGTAAAQQHQHETPQASGGEQQAETQRCMMMGQMGQMMQMMQMVGGTEGSAMMDVMRLSPGHVLEHRTALGLSTKQVADIGSLEGATMAHDQAGMSGKKMPMMAGMSDNKMTMKDGMTSHMDRIGAAFATVPADPVSIRAAVSEMSTNHADMMSGHLVASARVRDILTPAQREQLAGFPMPCMSDEHGEKSGSQGAAAGSHE